MKVTFAHTGRGQVTRDMDHVPRSGESITLNGETWIADGVAWMLDGEPEALVLLKTKQEYVSAFRRGLRD